jgi:hypothetical protein
MWLWDLKMSTFPEMTKWLTFSVITAPSGRYEHALGLENLARRKGTMPRLREVLDKAHDDARTRIRSLAGHPLDPLRSSTASDPAKGYPRRLHLRTLKGYFGEVMAGLVAENVHPFGHDDWEVPAYLFRFHLVEFQQLEMMNQAGAAAKLRPGRTGDDCLAFRRGRNNEITSILFCEAKCTKGHKSSLVCDAHEKSSLPNVLPVDVLQLVEVLLDSQDANARKWVAALRALRQRGPQHPRHERLDQVTYVHGRRPTNKPTWIPTAKPHTKYTAKRRLHVAEIFVDGVNKLVGQAYRRRKSSG